MTHPATALTSPPRESVASLATELSVVCKGPDPALAGQACQKLLILRAFGDSSFGEPAGLRRGRVLLVMGLYADLLDLLTQLSSASHRVIDMGADYDAMRQSIQKDPFLGSLVERPDEVDGLLANSWATLEAMSILGRVQVGLSPMDTAAQDRPAGPRVAPKEVREWLC